jgi:hypothetical protein
LTIDGKCNVCEKVVLLTFAEHREDFYEKRKPLVEKYSVTEVSALRRSQEHKSFFPGIAENTSGYRLR